MEAPVFSRNLRVYEPPKNIELFRLPLVNSPTGKVRLGIHTDAMGCLLRAFYSIPTDSSLLIEGRLIDDGQDNKLCEHPLFALFDSRRFMRTMAMKQLATFLSQEYDREFDPDKLLFLPQTLQPDLGHQVGWFNTQEMVQQWFKDNTPNKMLPILRGVNAFLLGSDRLSLEEIQESGQKITESIRADDARLEQVRSTLPTHRPGNAMYDEVFMADFKAAHDLSTPGEIMEALEELGKKYPQYY